MSYNDYEMRYYDYADLKAAVQNNPTQENINALGEWFSNFDMNSWNGEYYDAGAFEVWPILEEVEEDEYELKGYEIR